MSANDSGTEPIEVGLGELLAPYIAAVDGCSPAIAAGTGRMAAAAAASAS